VSRSIRIWIAVAHSPAYRCGGWAAVRVCEGQVAGAAGGERKTTAGRMALCGLATALRDLPPLDDPASAAPVRIPTTSAELAAFAGFLASLAEPTQAAAPEEDLDLWARIFTAAKGRRLELSYAPPTAGTPGAFAAAWADLAFDKAKAKGAFASAIPKPNLAKIPGLDG
jgi:ribonuclease HI